MKDANAFEDTKYEKLDLVPQNNVRIVETPIGNKLTESVSVITNYTTRNNENGNKYEQNLERKQRFSPPLRQTFVALGPILITISLGMAEGYSAILLPQLETENVMPIDDELASWIASMTALPMALGCFFGSILMEKMGRKMTHMLTCFPCIGGWLIIYFATNTDMILAGRFLTGFCVGLLGPPTGVYMSETSEPKFRGFLLASISFAIAFGLFLSHILGTFLSWQNTALISCSFPVACLIIMVFAPESPTWYAKVGKTDEAIKSFHWCRGYSREAQEELDVLLERQGTLNDEPKMSIAETIKDLNKPEFIKPLLIIMIFFVTMQWSGNNALTFYCVTIMKQTLGDNLNEYTAMIIVDCIRLLVSIIACVALKRFGRRPLAIFSGCGSFISLFTLSGFIYFSKIYLFHSTYIVIPMTALVCYISCLTVGFVPLPWTMMGEVFPLANRGIGSGISSMSAYVAMFSVVKTTPGLFQNFGTAGAFMTYGVLCFLGTMVLVAFLPETKDKPLYVIEDHFKRKHKTSNV